MAGSNVLRAITPRHNPTQDAMNRLLKPLRIKLRLARIEESADGGQRSCSVHQIGSRALAVEQMAEAAGKPT